MADKTSNILDCRERMHAVRKGTRGHVWGCFRRTAIAATPSITRPHSILLPCRCNYAKGPAC